MSSLKKLAIQGTIWTFIGYGGSQTLRLGANLILTRLLVPEMFGLMALVHTFITGLNLFSDLGIQPSIIRSKRWNDLVFLNTAWTLQVIRGFGLWLATIALAWPVAKFYGDASLLWILPVVGLTTMMNGFSSVSLATLNRQLEIGKLARFELGIQTVSLTIMIVWSYLWQTIWALIGGSLLSNCISTFASYSLAPEMRHRFAWDKKAIQELVSFGKWIFVSTALSFLANQSDRLILGKLLSLEMLGIYAIAFTFADLPKQLMNQVSSRIIFPLFSQHSSLPRQTLRNKILEKRRVLLIIMAPLVVLIISFGDYLILGLYDSRYSEAAWMMPMLSLGLWHTMLYGTMSYTLLAIGQSVYLAQGMLLRALTVIIGLPMMFYKMGITAAIIVVAFSDLPLYLIMIYGLWKEGLSCVQQDIKMTAIFVISLFVVLSLRFILGLGLPFDNIIKISEIQFYEVSLNVG